MKLLITYLVLSVSLMVTLQFITSGDNAPTDGCGIGKCTSCEACKDCCVNVCISPGDCRMVCNDNCKCDGGCRG